MCAKCMSKIFDAKPTFMITPTNEHRHLTASLEHSSILCTKVIKKQLTATPECKQRRPKIPEVSICAFCQYYDRFSIVI